MPPQDPLSGSVRRRAAWTLVIIMTVLLALAFVAVVWGFIRQGRILLETRAARQAPAASSPSGGIVLPPGARILSSETAAGRLVLHLATPEGEQVEIIDLSSGRLVQTIKTRP
jgi:hypothetical protein